MICIQLLVCRAVVEISIVNYFKATYIYQLLAHLGQGTTR